MWLDLFRKPIPEDFLQGFCDMHSHLLPGVDDGFPSLEMTLDGLAFLAKKGVRKVKMTPHFMKDYQGNTRAAIETKYQELLCEIANSVDVELTLGGEYMLDSCFPDRMEEGFLTLDCEETLVLCETSYMNQDPNANQMLYELMLKGYQPVIAHPERYAYATPRLYKRYKEKDYLFQLNLLSLAEAYGKEARIKALWMLKEGMYDFVGSDLHRLENVSEMIDHIKLSTKEIDQLLQLKENNQKL